MLTFALPGPRRARQTRFEGRPVRRATVTVATPARGERMTVVAASSTRSALGERRNGSGSTVAPRYDMTTTSERLRGPDQGMTRSSRTASCALPPASIATAVWAPSDFSRRGLVGGGHARTALRRTLDGHEEGGAVGLLADGRARGARGRSASR